MNIFLDQQGLKICKHEKTLKACQYFLDGSSFKERLIRSVGGVAVSIVAFQAADPGSTPGQRKYFCCFNYLKNI
jgi:hypothetical protein